MMSSIAADAMSVPPERGRLSRFAKNLAENTKRALRTAASAVKKATKWTLNKLYRGTTWTLLMVTKVVQYALRLVSVLVNSVLAVVWLLLTTVAVGISTLPWLVNVTWSYWAVAPIQWLRYSKDVRKTSFGSFRLFQREYYYDRVLKEYKITRWVVSKIRRYVYTDEMYVPRTKDEYNEALGIWDAYSTEKHDYPEAEHIPKPPPVPTDDYGIPLDGSLSDKERAMLDDKDDWELETIDMVEPDDLIHERDRDYTEYSEDERENAYSNYLGEFTARRKVNDIAFWTGAIEALGRREKMLDEEGIKMQWALVYKKYRREQGFKIKELQGGWNLEIEVQQARREQSLS